MKQLIKQIIQKAGKVLRKTLTAQHTLTQLKLMTGMALLG
jgi:hypothetical protein